MKNNFARWACLAFFLCFFLSPNLSADGFFSSLWKKTFGSSTEEPAEPQPEPESQTEPEIPKEFPYLVNSGVRNLNVREKPSLDSTVIKQIQGDEEITVLDNPELYLPVKTADGKTGWVEKTLVDQNSGQVRSGVNNLNVRSGPGLTHGVLRRIHGGTAFSVIAEEGAFVQIRLTDGDTGWIAADYLEKHAIINNDDTPLYSSGSPESQLIATLAKNLKVEVQTVERSFLHVRLKDGQQGYVYGAYISPSGNTETAGDSTDQDTGEPADPHDEPEAQTPVSDDANQTPESFTAGQNPLVEDNRFLKAAGQSEKILKITEIFSPNESSSLIDRLMRRNIEKSFPEKVMTLFQESPELKKQFSAELADNKQQFITDTYKNLVELSTTPELLQKCGRFLENGDFRSAAQCTEAEISNRSFFSFDTPQNPPDGDGEPIIMINIPAEKLRIYKNGFKIFECRIVVGQLDHPHNREGDNSRSRVGEFRIRRWVENYSNDSYPSWAEDKYRAAFGKWTAMLNDKNHQYIHGTYGGSFVSWAAVRIAPGSHGCVRCQNDDITAIKDLSPVGSKVIRFYTLTEMRKSGRLVQAQKLKNIYNYKDIEDNGVFYPETGLLVNYRNPSDAIGD